MIRLMDAPSLQIAVPDDIEDRIAQALLESHLNNAISEVLDDVCEKVKDPNSWDNPVRRALQNLTSEVITSMLKDDPAVVDAIKAAVLESFATPEFAESIAKQVFEKY